MEADDSLTEVALMVQAARSFYLHGQSKIAIAEHMGISRFKVARLLEAARERGIVRFEVVDPTVQAEDLHRYLAQNLQVEKVILVPDPAGPDELREELGRAAAGFLGAYVRGGMSIGVSWGRTLACIGRYLPLLPPINLVQLTGMLEADAQQSPLRIIASIADNRPYRTFALAAPMFASSAQLAERLRREPSTVQVMERYDSLDVALLSVGSWTERITQLDKVLPAADVAELDRAQVVADCAGLFFASDGTAVKTALGRRRISVSVEQLRHTRQVVAVAGGVEKAQAILAMVRSGVINTLVTTTATAARIVQLDKLDRAQKKSPERA
ncbi:sugar-binding transcriptional regulator [Trueperella sp. LYQ143]|uniref:sugar-binding transcriptional regulator n=1 Tax=unclassified Trueperella TaxID=2630174 RepID=UPI0039839E7E